MAAENHSHSMPNDRRKTLESGLRRSLAAIFASSPHNAVPEAAFARLAWPADEGCRNEEPLKILQEVAPSVLSQEWMPLVSVMSSNCLTCAA